MSTTRNPNVEYVGGNWQFKPEYLSDSLTIPLLPKQWNPSLAEMASRLQQMERQQQQMLNQLVYLAKAVDILSKRPGLTPEDVSKLLEFSDSDKSTLDSLLAGNIINRLNAIGA